MNHLRPRLTSTRPAMAGFSLLELLLALGLTVILAGAIFGAIRIQLHLKTTGEKEVRKAQLTRALLRQFQADVACLVFTPPETETEETESDDTLSLDSSSTGTSSSSSGTGSSGTGSSATGTGSTGTATTGSDSTSTETTTDGSVAISNPAAGLVGTAEELTLHVSRPLHPLRLSTTVTVTADSLLSDEKTISWFLNGSNGITADNGTGSSSGDGLARLEGDRFAIDYAAESGGLSGLGTLTKVLAPEVQTLAFRYYDGTQWVDSWDSLTMGRLPQAVEVTLGLQLETETETVLGTRVTPELEYVTHVLRIPLQEPYVENMGL